MAKQKRCYLANGLKVGPTAAQDGTNNETGAGLLLLFEAATFVEQSESDAPTARESRKKAKTSSPPATQLFFCRHTKCQQTFEKSWRRLMHERERTHLANCGSLGHHCKGCDQANKANQKLRRTLFPHGEMEAQAGRPAPQVKQEKLTQMSLSFLTTPPTPSPLQLKSTDSTAITRYLCDFTTTPQLSPVTLSSPPNAQQHPQPHSQQSSLLVPYASQNVLLRHYPGALLGIVTPSLPESSFLSLTTGLQKTLQISPQIASYLSQHQSNKTLAL